VNYQKYQNLMLLTSSSGTKRALGDASIIVYKFRPERTGFNMDIRLPVYDEFLSNLTGLS